MINLIIASLKRIWEKNIFVLYLICWPRARRKQVFAPLDDTENEAWQLVLVRFQNMRILLFVKLIKYWKVPQFSSRALFQTDSTSVCILSDSLDQKCSCLFCSHSVPTMITPIVFPGAPFKMKPFFITQSPRRELTLLQYQQLCEISLVSFQCC